MTVILSELIALSWGFTLKLMGLTTNQACARQKAHLLTVQFRAGLACFRLQFSLAYPNEFWYNSKYICVGLYFYFSCPRAMFLKVCSQHPARLLPENPSCAPSAQHDWQLLSLLLYAYESALWGSWNSMYVLIRFMWLFRSVKVSGDWGIWESLP